MTITLHVDPCPTCHGSGQAEQSPGQPLDGFYRCPDCLLVPGYQVHEWVVVPTGCECRSCLYGATRHPHPGWQPGTEIPVTATCPSNDCENGRLWDDREMAHPGCDGTGEVTVGTVRITELVPVRGDLLADWLDRFIYAEGGDVALVIGDTITPLDIVCSPGDTLARLERTETQ